MSSVNKTYIQQDKSDPFQETNFALVSHQQVHPLTVPTVHNNGPDGGGSGGYAGGGGTSGGGNNTQGVRTSQQDKPNQSPAIQLHHTQTANHILSGYHPARPPSQPPPNQGGIGPQTFLHFNPSIPRQPPQIANRQLPPRPQILQYFDSAICGNPFYQPMPMLPVFSNTGTSEGGRVSAQASYPWSNATQAGVTLINPPPPAPQQNPQQQPQPQPSPYPQGQFSYIPRVNHAYSTGGTGAGGAGAAVVQQPPQTAVIVERQLAPHQLLAKQKISRKNRIPIIHPDTGLEINVEELASQGGGIGGSGHQNQDHIQISSTHHSQVHHSTSNQASSGDSARIAADFANQVLQAVVNEQTTRVSRESEECQVNGPGSNEQSSVESEQSSGASLPQQRQQQTPPPVVQQQTKRPTGPTPVVSAQAEGTTYDIQSIRNSTSSSRVEMRSGESSPARNKIQPSASSISSVVNTQNIPSLITNQPILPQSNVVQVPQVLPVQLQQIQVQHHEQPQHGNVVMPPIIHHQMSGQTPHQPNELIMKSHVVHHNMPQPPVSHSQQQIVIPPQPVVMPKQQVFIDHPPQPVVMPQHPPHIEPTPQAVVMPKQQVFIDHPPQPVVIPQHPTHIEPTPQPVVIPQQPCVIEHPPQPAVIPQQSNIVEPVVISKQPVVHPPQSVVTPPQQVVHPQPAVKQTASTPQPPVVQSAPVQVEMPKQQRPQRRVEQPAHPQQQVQNQQPEKKPTQVSKASPQPQPVDEKDDNKIKNATTNVGRTSPLITTAAPTVPVKEDEKPKVVTKTPDTKPPVKVVEEIKKEKPTDKVVDKQSDNDKSKQTSAQPVAPVKPTAFADSFSLHSMKITAKAATSAVQAAQTATAAQQDTVETVEVNTQVKSLSRSKPKGKHKMREMNQKGVEKEGTDMDAFVDTKNTENNNRSSNDKLNDNNKEILPTQDIANNNVNNQNTNQIEDNKEDSIVLAKNEENNKLNQQVEKEKRTDEDSESDVCAGEESGEDSSCQDDTSQSNQQLSHMSLKYQYKDDQWSPVNPEGKKIYDRDFLMKLRDDPLSAKKPDITTDLEIFVKEGHQGGNIPGSIRRMNSHSQHGSYGSFGSGGSMRGNNNGLYPEFISRSMSQRMPPKRNSSQGGGGGRGPGVGGGRSLKQMYNNSLSLKDDYKWVSGENAWKPTKLIRGQDNKNKEERETEELYKKVRGILNKLTPQKFETLVLQFQNLPIDSLQRLQGTISLVFDKAVDEPKFSVSYAQLCKVLAKLQVVENQGGANDQQKQQNQENQQPSKEQAIPFRKILITRCQQEFEANKKLEMDFEKRQQEINECVEPDKKKELQLQFNEEERKIRMKSVGLVTFIGELFKLKMLTPSIMHRCAKQLLGKIDEESLECLCKLLTTIGKEFEEQISSGKNKEAGMAEFNDYFAQMSKLSRKHVGSKVSSRVRFMLQDVIELRSNKWVPRRDENKPKTMAQIQEEVERESEKAAMMAAQSARSMNMNMNQDRGNRRNNPRGGNMPSEDGWTNVTNNKYRGNYAVEASKMQGLKSIAGQELLDRNAQLTLGTSSTFYRWGTGAGTGTRSTTSSGSVFTDNNTFSCLDERKMPMGGRMIRRNDDKDNKQSDKDNLLQNIGSIMRSTSNNSDRDNSRGRGTSPSVGTSGPQRKPLQLDPPTRRNIDRSNDVSRESTPASTTPMTESNRVEETEQQQTIQPLTEPKKVVDEDKLKQYATTLIKEYLVNQNIQESIESYKELFTNYSSIFISTCINYLLEQSKKDTRSKVSQLLGEFIKHQMYEPQTLQEELGFIFECINDIEVDIPHIWKYLGEVFGVLMSCEALDFNHLKAAKNFIPSDQTNNNKLHQTLTELFSILTLEKGPVWIKSCWDSSGVKISDFISDAPLAEKFLVDHAFLEGKEVAVSDSNIPYEKIQEKLMSFLQDSKENFDLICGWLTSNVGKRTNSGKFIRELTEAVINSSLVTVDTEDGKKVQKVDNKLLKKNLNLIKRYVDNNEDLELWCLYSVQYLVVIKLESPPGMIVEIFRELYENSVISPEGFNKWKSNGDIKENWQRSGQGVAIASLNSFFQALEAEQEAEQDDDQDDEAS